MTEHTNTYPDLVNVEDWLNAKGYTGEAGACHQAMSLIRSQEKRIAEFEAVQLAQDKLILEYCSQITELENSEPAGFPEWVEAKNARIAELEALLSQTNEGYAECIATREDYRARISELEAAIESFASEAGKYPDLHDTYLVLVPLAHLRAARAAYLGEKE